MKKERLTPAWGRYIPTDIALSRGQGTAGCMYSQQEERLSVSVQYTVKFTRFTDGRSTLRFLLSAATPECCDGKDTESFWKSFTCEPFFYVFLSIFLRRARRVFRFTAAKLRLSLWTTLVQTGSFAGSNWSKPQITRITLNTEHRFSDDTSKNPYNSSDPGFYLHINLRESSHQSLSCCCVNHFMLQFKV